MDFGFDATTQELRERLLRFMDEGVYPAEERFRAEVARADDPWQTPPVLAELKAQARERGLWNLFLPPVHDCGAGLTNLQYAPLAEITGRSQWIAPEALNCSAPDTGNMELLSLFGTPEQKARWLDPLLEGRIRSAFSMTEPDVASSDATNIATRIERDGDEYVVTGRKWWTSGAMSPRCELLIVMGVTDPDAERHRRQSMLLVPKATPRSSTTACACPPPTSSAPRATASGSRRSGSARAASTTRCGSSAWRSARPSCCAGAPPPARRSGGRSSSTASSSAGSRRRACG